MTRRRPRWSWRVIRSRRNGLPSFSRNAIALAASDTMTRFCVKAHTAEWGQFPQDVEDTPEVYVRFSRRIRDGNGESMERNRFKAILDLGRDHNETLWFRTG